jgi:hypothetical protein
MPTERLRYSDNANIFLVNNLLKCWRTQMKQSNEKNTDGSTLNDTEHVSPQPGNTPVVVAESDTFPPTSIPIPPDPDAVKTS